MRTKSSILLKASLVFGVTLGLIGLTVFGPSHSARAESPEAGVAKVQDLAAVFRDVGHKIEPSVVNIKVTKTIKGRVHPRLPMDDDLLKKFFPDRNGDGKPDVPPGFGDDHREFQQQGQGSGVIVEVQGSTAYVVTNNHVAGDADKMTLTLADGREIKNGSLVGADPKSDVAVIKIEGDKLIAAKWGDSDQLDRGDWVLAFGSPLGFVGSMTHGIVSALHRNNVSLPTADLFENFIQVDAPINPGNSGGPLVNIRGEVVGINAAIASQSGGFQGIGFAIPSNYVQKIYKSLKENGKVSRGWMGVGMVDASNPDETIQRDLKATGFEGDKGAFIMKVYRGTPAYGKLEPSDVVTEMDGRAIKDMNDLRDRVADTIPGTVVKLKVWRDHKFIEVPVTLAERPVNPEVVDSSGKGHREEVATLSVKLGVRLSNVNSELAEKYELGDAKTGALVTDVVEGSPAAQAGLTEGDLITRVNKKEVANSKAALEEIEKHDLSKGIRLSVTSKDGSRLVSVMVEK